MHLDPTGIVSCFVAWLPTFIAVLLSWMHLNSRMSGLHNNLNRWISETEDLMTAEFQRSGPWTAG